MAKKITQSKDYEEVAHYVIEQFMIHPRAQELVDNGEAMKFMSGMIWRSYKSSTSPYHKLYRQSGKVYSSANIGEHMKNFIEEEYDIETDYIVEAIHGILEDMESESQEMWYLALLFKMYQETPNFSELERLTKIPRTSISHAVNQCKKEIKNRLNANNN